MLEFAPVDEGTATPSEAGNDEAPNIEEVEKSPKDFVLGLKDVGFHDPNPKFSRPVIGEFRGG